MFVYGRPNPDGSDKTPPMSIINFDDLLGRTFLLPMDENGERKRATISEHVKDLYQDQVSREDQLRFKLKIDRDQLDDLISYNQLLDYLEDKTDPGPLEDGLYRFKSIKDQKGLTEVCQLLEVSWQMYHAWITHWTVVRATLTMSRRPKHARRTHAWSERARTLFGAHVSPFGASSAHIRIATRVTSARIGEPSMASDLHIKSSLPNTYE